MDVQPSIMAAAFMVQMGFMGQMVSTAQADFMVADSVVLTDLRQASMVRSAALIMEGSPGAIPSAGNQAWAEGSMAAEDFTVGEVSTAAEVAAAEATGNLFSLPQA
jgi:hypothetical protein